MVRIHWNSFLLKQILYLSPFVRTASLPVSVLVTVKVYHCANGDRLVDGQNGFHSACHSQLDGDGDRFIYTKLLRHHYGNVDGWHLWFFWRAVWRAQWVAYPFLPINVTIFMESFGVNRPWIWDHPRLACIILHIPQWPLNKRFILSIYFQDFCLIIIVLLSFNQTPIQLGYITLTETRMHSSRMRTARSLTESIS